MIPYYFSLICLNVLETADLVLNATYNYINGIIKNAYKS